MNRTRKAIAALTVLTAMTILVVFTGCNKDDSPDRKTTYDLKAKDVLGVTGTVTFIEKSSTTTNIEIVLNNAPSGIHPAQLCNNTIVEGGSVVLELNPVDATGVSSTTGVTMTYNELIAYNGFIKVIESNSEPDVIVAQGDIGSNVITTTKISYALDTVGSFGVSGTALFEKRVNGNTLVTITLTGLVAGESYPASINLGSIETVGGGPVVKILTNIDGTSGKGYTNIRKLDSDITITYDDWLVYDGYINIYQTSISLNNIICHGNIGSN